MTESKTQSLEYTADVDTCPHCAQEFPEPSLRVLFSFIALLSVLLWGGAVVFQ